MTTRRFALPSIAIALCALPAFAQMPGAKVASVTAKALPLTVARGGHGTLFLTVAVAPHYHINSNKPADKSLIPTVFTGMNSAGVTFGAAHYPTPKAIQLSSAKTPVLVYQGKTVIAIPYTVAKTAKAGRASLHGSLGYQACNELSCFPPSSLPVKAAITIK